jgi:hypothetical protein
VSHWESQALVSFIDTLPAGTLVLMAVRDDAQSTTFCEDLTNSRAGLVAGEDTDFVSCNAQGKILGYV